MTERNSKLPFSLAISGSSYGYKTTAGTFVAFRGDSTDTYTYASGSTGGTVDLGARNNYRYVNASNVYTKGKSDGVTTHTGTYTLTNSDFGATKDMGATHTYRYVKVPSKPSPTETKGANGNNSTALINAISNTSSRATITKSANFKTTKPCIVFGAIGCDWPTQSGKVVIHGVTLTMANTASSGLASFAWLLPNAGSYSISMSASVADTYYFYAAYFLLND